MKIFSPVICFTSFNICLRRFANFWKKNYERTRLKFFSAFKTMRQFTKTYVKNSDKD